MNKIKEIESLVIYNGGDINIHSCSNVMDTKSSGAAHEGSLSTRNNYYLITPLSLVSLKEHCRCQCHEQVGNLTTDLLW